MKSRAIGAGVGAALLVLAGCGDKTAEAPPQAVGTLPDNPTGITVTDAKVQLPVVAGRPGVAYFTVSQANGAPRTIVAVEVAGAGRAEMHETMDNGGMSSMKPVARVPIEPGNSVEFAPGGRHVMLFGIDPKLRAGGETEIIVSFAEGDSATAKADIVTLAGSAG
ncbi:MAG TPA: copper chaperone PCu(A)C [Novosphingobium sp.]|nr:copper chaperone PCu(A)C [Novosphingobium sp.]